MARPATIHVDGNQGNPIIGLANVRYVGTADRAYLGFVSYLGHA